jgi:hypothetical protein
VQKHRGANLNRVNQILCLSLALAVLRNQQNNHYGEHAKQQQIQELS